MGSNNYLNDNNSYDICFTAEDTEFGKNDLSDTKLRLSQLKGIIIALSQISGHSFSLFIYRDTSILFFSRYFLYELSSKSVRRLESDAWEAAVRQQGYAVWEYYKYIASIFSNRNAAGWFNRFGAYPKASPASIFFNDITPSIIIIALSQISGHSFSLFIYRDTCRMI